MNPGNGVSIVVCCYNSRSVLAPTLEHLARLKVPDGLLAEVVIVDNNSNDGTAEFAESKWLSLDTTIPLRTLRETTPGLSSARRTGILGSQYEFVVFCDDDNWLNRDYLLQAYTLLSRRPDILMCGGLGKPVASVTIPSWFPKFQKAYAVGPQATAKGPVNHYLHGAGICLRRGDLVNLYRLGFRSILSGRKGKSLSAGEDGEMAEWLKMSKSGVFWYDPNLQFSHYIRADRLTRRSLRQLKQGFARSAPILKLYQSLSSNKNLSLNALFAWQLSTSALQVFRSLPKCFLMEGRLSFWSHFESFAWLLRNYSTYRTSAEKILRYLQVSQSNTNDLSS
ncbi:glycosyltransferase [Crateriforma conspicua]|uniref:Putative glycosyltransferase EpsH n=1 Tax=Crateriforma conspicua TaxID=2527996 RepID=A0A5C5Y024_9PLAN|nr:glycosyltransferase [Crateriforma conspicua]TWT69066.1 putative glycosyltransferase EpsH [Crateriforma conspicua]